jgi:hypothetical protein
LPPQLPSTLFATEVYKQANKLGLEKEGEWDDSKINEMGNGLNEAQVGRALFEWVAACRSSGIDPESALRKFASSQVRILEEKYKSKS